MSKKYEQLVEFLMNGEQEKANALFHDIVVEASREIYENLIDDSDFAPAVSDDQTDELISDISHDVKSEEMMDGQEQPTLGSVLTAEDAKHLLDWLDGTVTETDNSQLIEKVAGFYGVATEGVRASLEENSDQLLDVAYGSVSEEEPEVTADVGMGQDMGGEEPMPGEEMPGEEPIGGEEMGGEEGLEDRVMDLEDALDELKAEFDHLMAGEEHEEEMEPGVHGEEGEEEMGGEEGEEGEGEEGGEEHEEMGSEEPEEKAEESIDMPRTSADLMREYVEKVSKQYGTDNTEGKEVGADGSVAVNKKSTVAGKNDMGGTVKNLVQGGAETAPDGTTANKGKSNEYMKSRGELPHAGKFENVPGADAGKTFSKSSKQYGSGNTEGKGVGNDGSISVNKKSLF